MNGSIRLGVVAVIGLGLATAMAEDASAQGRGRGFGRGFPRSKADLAAIEPVQAELKLTDEQKTQAEEIGDQLRSDRRDLFQGGFGRFSEIRGEMDELNRKASDEVMQLLDESQQKRLLGIAIQANGSTELSDPAVVEQLQLSDEQTSKLAEVESANSQTMADMFADAGQLSRDEWRSKARELRDKADEERLAVLTDEQKAQFKQMGGEPFEIDWSQFRGRFGRGGRGGENN